MLDTGFKPRHAYQLSGSDIEYIIEIYKQVQSIEKTVCITGFSSNTVHKHVRYMSSKSKHSRYNKLPVLKINPETLEILKEYASASIASKLTHIEYSNLFHALSGDTRTAGGYIWAYKVNTKSFSKLSWCKEGGYWKSLVREENVLLGLK